MNIVRLTRSILSVALKAVPEKNRHVPGGRQLGFHRHHTSRKSGHTESQHRVRGFCHEVGKCGRTNNCNPGNRKTGCIPSTERNALPINLPSNQSIINHILSIIFYFRLKNQTRYSAITYRVAKMMGCQKSKCSSSWPPITTFTCIVNIQTFIPTFTPTHSIPMATQTNWKHRQIKGPNNINYTSCNNT